MTNKLLIINVILKKKYIYSKSKKMMTWIIIILLVVITFFLIIFYFRERFMFIPTSFPNEITGGTWIEVNGYISAYLMKKKNIQNDTLILYSHGNGGNLTWYTKTAYLLRNFGDVMLYDYPGYGFSKGNCNEKNALNSGLDIYDYVTTLGYKKIFLYGFSMGGAVSVQIASERCKTLDSDMNKKQPDGLILQSTFSRISDCVPLIGEFIVGNFFRSIDKISSLNCPVIVLHSKEDKVVPYESSINLFKNLNTRKKFISIKGGHNSPILNEEILKQTFDFLKESD